MSVLVLGAPAAGLRARLAEVGPVVGSGAADAVVLVIAGAPADRAEATGQAWRPLELLAAWRAEGALPARLTVLDEAGGDELSRVRSALLDTVVRYATGALFHGGPAINCVRAEDPAAVPATFDLVVALASGLLDGVRGQTLVVRA